MGLSTILLLILILLLVGGLPVFPTPAPGAMARPVSSVRCW